MDIKRRIRVRARVEEDLTTLCEDTKCTFEESVYESKEPGTDYDDDPEVAALLREQPSEDPNDPAAVAVTLNNGYSLIDIDVGEVRDTASMQEAAAEEMARRVDRTLTESDALLRQMPSRSTLQRASDAITALGSAFAMGGVTGRELNATLAPRETASAVEARVRTENRVMVPTVRIEIDRDFRTLSYAVATTLYIPDNLHNLRIDASRYTVLQHVEEHRVHRNSGRGNPYVPTGIASALDPDIFRIHAREFGQLIGAYGMLAALRASPPVQTQGPDITQIFQRYEAFYRQELIDWRNR